MAKKYESILEKHKYAISIFVFFFVYNFVVVGNFSFPAIDSMCYTFHIVDYSIGLCSELLPGAIYNALIPTTSAEAVNLYINILYHLFLLAVSFILEKFLYKFDSKNRFIAFIIVLFLITGPSTFSIHTIEIGMLDSYWLFFAAIFLMLLQNKYLKWLVPAVFVLSIFVHIGAMISFIPFFAILVLFEASQNEKINKSYMIIFSISVFLAIAAFIYIMAFEESNLFLSNEEFHKLISERNISEWPNHSSYYEYSLYRMLPDDIPIDFFPIESEVTSFEHIFGVLWRQIKAVFIAYSIIRKEYFVDFARDFFVSMPVIIFLYKAVLSFFKKDKENKLRRFVWFCTLCLLPFTFLTSILICNDAVRFFGHGIICLFALVLYGLYKSPDNDYIKALKDRFNNSSKIAIIVYWVFYMMCTVEPYT